MSLSELLSVLKMSSTVNAEDLTGQKPPKMSFEDIMAVFHPTSTTLKCPFKVAVTDDYFSSFEPLSNLKKISLGDLLVNVRALRSFLMLRCLDALREKDSIMLVVEDHHGDITVCCVRFPVFMTRKQQAKEEFPLGTVLLIKEPCLKQCLDSSFVTLAVDSPTDLVEVTRNHNIFQETVVLGWNDVADYPKDALGCKNQGDNSFAIGQYQRAIEAYLMGLKLNPEMSLKKSLHLNLTAAYLVTEFYESCLHHTSQVLLIEPENEKALFRSGRCHYELRQYESAKKQFEELHRVNPSDTKAPEEAKRCQNRLSEQEGCVNVFDLFQASHSHKTKVFDFGDYVGPVDVVPVPEKGRGVIATRDISPGSLIIAEKALVSEMIEDSWEQFGMKHISFGNIFRLSVCAIYKNPKTYGKLLDHASAKKDFDKVGILIYQEEDNTELFLDISRILEIIMTNTFTIRKRGGGLKHSHFFHLSSYINHSCVPNCSMITYNNVMLIRTTTLVKKGQEISIAYIVNLGSRLEELVHTFICKCEYCQLESQDPMELKQEREELASRAKSSSKSELGMVVKALEKTYRNREKYRTVLFHPYLQLAEYGGDFKRGNFQDYQNCFMIYANKALSCLGLSTDILLRCAEDQNKHFPEGALLTDEDLLYEVSLKIMSVQTSPALIEKWQNVLLMLERVFHGGNLTMIREKFPEVNMFIR